MQTWPRSFIQPCTDMGDTEFKLSIANVLTIKDLQSEDKHFLLTTYMKHHNNVSETLFLILITTFQRLLLSQFPKENTKIPKVKQANQTLSARAEFKSWYRYTRFKTTFSIYQRWCSTGSWRFGMDIRVFSILASKISIPNSPTNKKMLVLWLIN